jgi:hypothetical protein
MLTTISLASSVRTKLTVLTPNHHMFETGDSSTSMLQFTLLPKNKKKYLIISPSELLQGGGIHGGW